MTDVSIDRARRRAGWTLGALLALTGAALAPSAGHAATAPAGAAACAKLQGFTLPASAIGGATKGAVVKDAKLMPAEAQRTGPANPFNPTGLVPGHPEYCAVTGEIAPVDPAAPPIRFQVSLPSVWNGKVIHMGGGGFDGSVVTGLDAAPRAPDATPLPIARGYATFGSDSGHNGNDAGFAANPEALANFAGDQLKKTHDVAVAVIKARYGKAQTKMYFVGQSEGGREGMTVAQRWPADYDGVVVTAPAMNFANAMFHFNVVSTAISRPGGYLSPAKVKTFAAAVLAQCDMNDGVADGIVGNYLGCNFDRSVLRCPGGLDAGDNCLSDGQLASIDALYRQMIWRGDDGKVIADYPRYLVGGGEEKPGAFPIWIFGRAPLPRSAPAGADLSQQKLGLGIAPYYAASAIRYLVVKNPAFDPYDFDPRPYAPQIQAIAKALSSSDPDLSAFEKRGGKLIMLHNTADSAVSPVGTMTYYDRVTTTLGKDEVAKFMRLYIVPGGDHTGGGGVPSKVDLVGMIDTWVVGGKAPGDDWIAEEDGPDMKPVRTKPLCAYPYYPRYAGMGDAKDAASYRCVVSRPGAANP